MKITIEMTVGGLKSVSTVERAGVDETIQEAIELFSQALRGLGYTVGTLEEEN